MKKYLPNIITNVKYVPPAPLFPNINDISSPDVSPRYFEERNALHREHFRELLETASRLASTSSILSGLLAANVPGSGMIPYNPDYEM